MQNILSILAIVASGYLFAQQPKGHYCFKRDAFEHNQLKSNSLTVAQIAETERYDVHFYALDIEMDNLSTDIMGTAEIHGTARETLDSVLVELFTSFTISDIRLDGVSMPYGRTGSAITVPVNLTTGQPFIIAIDYNGTPPTAATNPLGGAGMSNASSPTWGNQVTWSLSEPFSAYEWWPCKQSLKDKADSCQVFITVPNSCKAGSNGVLENIVDLGTGKSRYEWKHRHPIDYYLISVAVAEYVEYNVSANPAGAPGPVLIQNYIYDNPLTLTTFQNDIDETVDFIELFADKFGPYPFDDEKYGHCMVPISGGMEHQTMTSQGFFNKGLTSHELGHQWWGDNVTCASWADIWVNEGFASYCEYIMLENLYPGQKDQLILDWHNNVMSNPNGSTWVLDSLNEGRIFSGRLTYDKGGSIIHTFRYMMDNDSLFFAALQQIQSDMADSTAYGIDYRDHFMNVSGVDFTAAFNEWYFGEGYPTYSATWNTVGGDLVLEVTHTTSSSTPTFTNPIELRFSRSGAPDTTIRVDITSNTDQFTIPGMGNATNCSGIDPDNWVINEVGSIVHDPTFGVNGIEENNVANYYSIYPNPTAGEVIISTEHAGKNDLIVYDLRGREVIHSTFEGSTTVDLSSQLNGYYIVHLINEKGEKRIETLAKN